jgi:hypothetical protein
MTVGMEINEALDESFRAAFVLTGSIETAEGVVADAIGALAPDLPVNALLGETVRSAFRHGFQLSKGPASSSILPLELHALSLLSPISRYCFVALILLRLDIAVCSEILTLSKKEVEEALYGALLKLAGAIEFLRRTESMVGLRADEVLDFRLLQIPFLTRTS